MKNLFIMPVVISFLLATTINIPTDFSTIQGGIDASVNGDTVLVQPGTYVENINFNGHNVTLGSLFLTTADTSYISQTVIDGNQNGSVVSLQSGESSAKLIGFTIQNGYAPNGGGIIVENHTHCLLSNLIITNNTAYSPQGGGGGIICTWLSSPTIEHTLIKDNESIGTDYYGGGGGIYCYYYSSPQIRDVEIRNNTANKGGGIYCNYYSSNPTLDHVLISDNVTISYGAAIYCDNSSPTLNHVTLANNFTGHPTIQSAIFGYNGCVFNITNSILWNQYVEEIYLDAAGQPNTVNITYTDIEGYNDQIIFTDNTSVNLLEGTFDENPLFTNIFIEDYSLQGLSPCINAGDPDYPLDPDNSISDIGTFFYYQDPEDQILGCIDFTALNFDPDANTDDGSCEYDLENGLVACYPFPGNTNDYSGNSNNGISNGGGYAPDRFGYSNNSFSFDGSSFIVIQESPEFESNSHTLALWIKPNENSNGDLFSKDGECYSRQWLLGLPISSSYNHKIRAHVWTTNQIYYFTSNQEYIPNEWNFLTQVWDGFSLKLYINNVLDTELATIGDLSFGDEPIRIGGGSAADCNTEYNYTGFLDDVRFYNRALNENEINQLYAEIQIQGCTDNSAYNFDDSVTTDDGSCIYYGDVTMDGNIDVVDVILMVAFVLETMEPTTDEEALGDVVPDGLINIMDIVQVIDWILNGDVLADMSPLQDSQITLKGLSLFINSTGDVAGIQLETVGDFTISQMTIPDGWILEKGNTGLIVLSLDGSRLNGNSLFTIDGNIKIVSALTVDWFGNGVQASINVIPEEFELHPSYPNPFNPITTISYGLPEDSFVQIRIYDLNGRQITDLVNDTQSAGTYQVNWNASNQSSGVYLVKMVAEDYQSVQKVMLVK